ncbi:hypothetical protein AMATHDRAFT_66206 [Amanita thiersii Skay4041]|uniref:Uncharacterized protein n=1 Tax=Amanita thiersii Skay4041 TaxID=703135 RepID=A0A2A9NK83_9AGAR|nr:hypothetical protein AMATHDRAFT_66206 [Amanita thiersii Skay4041]
MFVKAEWTQQTIIGHLGQTADSWDHDMLAWRTLSRHLPVGSLSRQCRNMDIQSLLRTQKRLVARHYYHPASVATRPNTLGARVWFRKDGTPRSKWKGVAYSSLIFCTLYIGYAMLVLIQELDSANNMYAILVHIQRADIDFSTANLSTPKGALAYFRQLCESFEGIPEGVLDTFTDNIAIFLSSEVYDESAKAEIHRILREGCEGVHTILQESRKKDALVTAAEVITAMDKQVTDLVRCIEKFVSDDEFAIKNLKIGDHVKDASRGDYEVVG